MKRSNLATSLALVVAVSLAGCGGGGSNSSSGGGATVAGGGTPTPSPTPSPSPSPTPTSTPTPTPTPGNSSRQDALNAAMLAEHNAARAEVGVDAAVLDANLSRQALEYAEEMARTGNFQHSPGSARPNQGENLWAGTESAFSYQQMSGAWIDEKRYYVHDRFPYVSNTGRWQDVGHYTQIIWRNSTQLGCGIATGRGRDWLVCRYSPPGNVVGQFAY